MDVPLVLTPPADPVPLGPVHAEAARTAHFTLRWQPSPGAKTYRIQIASDHTFAHPVFTSDVTAPAETLDLEYPAGGSPRLFYWRVLAKTDAGWSPGHHIEVLTLGAAHEGGPHPDPDVLRDFGVEPTPGLDFTPLHHPDEPALEGAAGFAPPTHPTQADGTAPDTAGGHTAEVRALSIGMFLFAVAVILTAVVLAVRMLTGT